jgi:hypothetical protein
MTNLLFPLILALTQAPALAMEEVVNTFVEPCPVARPAQLTRLQQFFGAEQTYSFRAAHGLLGIGPADVRALTDAQDAGSGALPAGTVAGDDGDEHGVS